MKSLKPTDTIALKVSNNLYNIYVITNKDNKTSYLHQERGPIVKHDIKLMQQAIFANNNKNIIQY
jgi:uncharacterized membrane protein SpoIIM required for sporulation